jgi:glycosyltransferase involved in cell wall biosynthesis
VLAQEWPHVHHVVVSDGPDPELMALLAADPELDAPVEDGRLLVTELPEHDPDARWGHWARLRGIELARGDMIAYLDDDNAYRPNHLSSVVTQMLAEDTDFGYAVGLFQGRGQPYPVGSAPPSYAQIDTSLIVHRRELLKRGTWEQSMPTIDWDLVERWLAAGARWSFVPYVTMDYYFSG